MRMLRPLATARPPPPSPRAARADDAALHATVTKASFPVGVPEAKLHRLMDMLDRAAVDGDGARRLTELALTGLLELRHPLLDEADLRSMESAHTTCVAKSATYHILCLTWRCGSDSIHELADDARNKGRTAWVLRLRHNKQCFLLRERRQERDGSTTTVCNGLYRDEAVHVVKPRRLPIADTYPTDTMHAVDYDDGTVEGHEMLARYPDAFGAYYMLRRASFRRGVVEIGVDFSATEVSVTLRAGERTLQMVATKDAVTWCEDSRPADWHALPARCNGRHAKGVFDKAPTLTCCRDACKNPLPYDAMLLVPQPAEGITVACRACAPLLAPLRPPCAFRGAPQLRRLISQLSLALVPGTDTTEAILGRLRQEYAEYDPAGDACDDADEEAERDGGADADDDDVSVIDGRSTAEGSVAGEEAFAGDEGVDEGVDDVADEGVDEARAQAAEIDEIASEPIGARTRKRTAERMHPPDTHAATLPRGVRRFDASPCPCPYQLRDTAVRRSSRR